MAPFSASLLPVLLATTLALRRSSKKHDSGAGSGDFTYLTPSNTNLKQVGVVMNPGGLVQSTLYVESMKQWQAEAERAGISLWVSILDYWFNLPIPIRTKVNIINAIEVMQGSGLPKSAPVYFTGHSMGGGAPLPVVKELREEGVLAGAILQAAFITRSFLPPTESTVTFPTPTLTVGAELNYGQARPTRFAEAVYHQGYFDHPVVVIEGMNHGQYFTGGSFEDIKPEITHERAQQIQAKIVVDWLAKELQLGFGFFLADEVKRTREWLRPMIDAGILEGSRAYNVPNQLGTPGFDCPRGVCPEGSQWIAEAQAFVAGEDVVKQGVKIQNNFADLFPFAGGDREGRKPFIQDQAQEKVIQAYVMASNNKGDLGNRNGKDFTDDQSPFTTGELLAKFISRQYAGKSLLGRSLARDGDVCAELNQRAYEYAIRNAGEKTRQRFQAHGQELAFDATDYKGAGPLWVYGKMRWSERSGKMYVRSTGLFTEPGPREIDGNHYCKLLSPARAMEWVYIDGLKAKLFGDWQ